MATLSVGLLGRQSNIKISTLSLNLQPQRLRINSGNDSKPVEVPYHIKSADSPVVYLLSGMAGDGKSGYNNFLVEQLDRLGFTVVSLPSTFDTKFVYSVSEHAHPGFVQEDAKDLVNLVKAVEKNLSLRPRSRALLGMSLGALHTLGILTDPSARQGIQFDKYIMMNMPLDLNYSIYQLDSMSYDRTKLSSNDYDLARGQGYNLVTTFGGGAPNAQAIIDTIHRFGMKDLQMRYLIGMVLQEAVQGTALATKAVGAGPNLSSQEYWKWQHETKSWRVYDYLTNLVVPYFTNKFAQEGKQLDVWQATVAEPLLRKLASGKNFLFLHAMDDVLSRPEEIAALERRFPQNTVLSTCGGHMGALWHPTYLEPIANFLRN